MTKEIQSTKTSSKDGSKWRRSRHYPSSLAIPLKDTSANLSASVSEASEPVGFRNTTTAELVNNCIRRHTKTEATAGPTSDLEELTTLDEISAYGVGEEDRDKLIQLEITRLLAAVDNDEPLLFPLGATMGSGTRTLLHDLYGIAEQISCNLLICNLDTQAMYMESCRKMFDQETYLFARDILMQRLNPACPEKHPLQLESENSTTYFVVVDHITAIIARLCIRSVSLQSCQTRCIANLATLSMKLKVLEANSVQNAEISVENGDEIAQRLKYQLRTEHRGIIGEAAIEFKTDHNEEDKAKAAIYNLASRTATESESARQCQLYNLEMAGVRDTLLPLMRHLLQEIKGDSLRDAAQLLFGRDDGRPATRTFNTSSVVYGAGFSSHSTLITQDREGELGASASSQALVVCYNAFSILAQTARAIRSAPYADACQGSSWTFSWRFETLDGGFKDSDTLSTSSARTILSVMIPLLCCTTPVAKSMERMLHMETVTCHLVAGMFEIRSNVRFESMATLETRESQDGAAPPTDFRISTLATSALAKRRLAQRPSSPKKRGCGVDRVETDLAAKEYSHDMWRAQLHSLAQTIRSKWIIDESAIIVPCATYVLTVLTACLVLVAGGVAIGFTLGGHITGVDPFNITLFCWIMAGFLAAVSKSLMVKEWNWQDFLKRRCVCQSVTELSSVTGVDPQLIIAYLLHNEDLTIINVRGPFNNAFKRRNLSGFAIDVKPTLRTLLQSGLIPVQVATIKGPMLVIMEARKGFGDSISHYHSAGDHEDLICRMPQTKLDAESSIDSQDMVIEIDCPQWLRVVGVYNDLDCNFR